MSDPEFSTDDLSELERDKLLNSLLEKTLDLPESERQVYLDRHCPDPTLRAEVLELLDEDLGDFLEEPSTSGLSAGPESTDSPLMLVPLCYFGTLAIRRGDFETARELLEKAEKSQGTAYKPTLAHAVMHRSLGKVYQTLKRLDDAARQFQKAVAVLESLDPTQSHLKELRQTRFELFQVQGFLNGDHRPQSVHDFLS